MKIAKSIALMMAGAGAVLAYQKYSEPVKKKIHKVMDKTIDKVNDKLEDMM